MRRGDQSCSVARWWETSHAMSPVACRGTVVLYRRRRLAQVARCRLRGAVFVTCVVVRVCRWSGGTRRSFARVCVLHYLEKVRVFFDRVLSQPGIAAITGLPLLPLPVPPPPRCRSRSRCMRWSFPTTQTSPLPLPPGELLDWTEPWGCWYRCGTVALCSGVWEYPSSWKPSPWLIAGRLLRRSHCIMACLSVRLWISSLWFVFCLAQTVAVSLVGSSLWFAVSLVGSSLWLVVCPVQTAVVRSLERNPYHMWGRPPLLPRHGPLRARFARRLKKRFS